MANWFYENSGASIGPVSEDVLRGWIRDGSVRLDQKIRRESDPQWRRVDEIPELMSVADASRAEPVQERAIEPASPSVPSYSFLFLTCRVVQVLGAITAVIGIVTTIIAIDKSLNMLPTGIAFLVNGVCVIGLGEAGLALRDMAINSFRK